MRNRAWRRYKHSIKKQRAIRRILWHNTRARHEDGQLVWRWRWLAATYSTPVYKVIAQRRSGEIEPEYNLRPYKRHGRRQRGENNQP